MTRTNREVYQIFFDPHSCNFERPLFQVGVCLLLHENLDVAYPLKGGMGGSVSTAGPPGTGRMWLGLCQDFVLMLGGLFFATHLSLPAFLIWCRLLCMYVQASNTIMT